MQRKAKMFNAFVIFSIRDLEKFLILEFGLFSILKTIAFISFGRKALANFLWKIA
jgi:hypothetical protein